MSSGQLAGRACTFGRTVILARMLGPVDYGIGATFAITVALLEMISDLSAGQLLIQAKDGDDPRLQSNAQTFHLVRGVVVGLLIFVSAPFVAELFDAPEATWAFRWLAAIPVVRGMYNVDVQRLQRDLRYGPDVGSFFFGEFAALLAAYPAVLIIGDYSAVLVVVAIQVLVWCTLTHVMAERRYTLSFQRELIGRLLTFGWPLLINGLLLFAAFQGDRVLVGSMYGPDALGVYAVAISLTLTPTLVLARVSHPMIFPLLAKVQNERDVFVARYRLCIEGLSAVGGAFGVALVLLGPFVVTFVFGVEYASAGVLVIWLGISQGIRVMRQAPTAATMARADTKATLYANTARSLGVGLALVAALKGFELEVIAASALAGEALAFVVIALRLSRLHGVPIAISAVPAMLAGAAMGGAMLVHRSPIADGNPLILLAVAVLLATGLSLLILILSKPWRNEVGHAITAARGMIAR